MNPYVLDGWYLIHVVTRVLWLAPVTMEFRENDKLRWRCTTRTWTKRRKNNTPAIYYNIIIYCARIIIGWFINLSLDTSSLRNDFNNSMCFIRSSYIVNKEAASLAPTSFFYFFIFYDWWFEQHVISRRCMQKTYTCRWI